MQRSINLKLIKMRTVILTVAMTIGMMFTTTAQVERYNPATYTPSVMDEPQREWYELDEKGYEGVQYMTSDDKFINEYLRELLKTDAQNYNRPSIGEHSNILEDEIVWFYEMDGVQYAVSYIKHYGESTISRQILD
jgi:hypothetical protein